MKILLCLALSLPFLSQTQPPPAATPASTTPTTSPTSIPPRPKLIIAPSDRQETKPLPTEAAAARPAGDLFFYPGVISKEGVGGDNFLNLSQSIPVQVNFFKADGVDIPFTQEKFQILISSLFEKGGISPTGSGNPPLPFFNLIVMIFPTAENGLAAACQARLFERVNVDRIQLRGETFQAITWEQTNLVFGASEDFERMLTSTIENIANTFVTRFNAQKVAVTK